MLASPVNAVCFSGRPGSAPLPVAGQQSAEIQRLVARHGPQLHRDARLEQMKDVADVGVTQADGGGTLKPGMVAVEVSDVECMTPEPRLEGPCDVADPAEQDDGLLLVSPAGDLAVANSSIP